mmetsp:Transcript_27212/g.59467  ORF Transcript_27212/g.59467 Transcript_27212/m.59467 type:complete len:209 (-) Transcript_27212:1316-1942(-)
MPIKPLRSLEDEVGRHLALLCQLLHYLLHVTTNGLILAPTSVTNLILWVQGQASTGAHAEGRKLVFHKEGFRRVSQLEDANGVLQWLQGLVPGGPNVCVVPEHAPEAPGVEVLRHKVLAVGAPELVEGGGVARHLLLHEVDGVPHVVLQVGLKYLLHRQQGGVKEVLLRSSACSRDMSYAVAVVDDVHQHLHRRLHVLLIPGALWNPW